MYGFYISYNEKNYKFLEGYNEELSLEDAINCINEKDKVASVTGTENVIEPIKIGEYTIKSGPYGMYITYNKKFYSIPKEYDATKLTKEQCDIIIKIPKKVYKKK